jgi:hypothetical protein
MGQEIVYCYWCSGRIMGTDFDKGAAVLIGNHACCAQCLPKVMASLPESQRETLLALLKGPPAAARQPSRITPRAVPAVSAGPEPPKSSTLKMGIIAGGVVVVGLLILWLGSGKKDEPRPPDPPPPPLQRSDTPDRSKPAREALQKARDAARSGVDIDLQAKLWEEALARAEGTPLREDAAREQAAFLNRRKEVIDQELSRLLDNVDTLIKDAEYKKAIDVLSSARNRRNVPEWIAGVDRKIEEARKIEAGGGPFRQDADGMVCIEAERFHAKTDLGEHAWTLVTAPPGYSGAGAMAALPNKGTGWLKDFPTTAPRLDYRVLFVKTGVHYVWARGHGPSGGDDSVHLGLDGKEVPSATGVTIGGKWAWTRKNLTNATSKIEIATAGVHTINLWAREDGTIVDRILLTTNDKYAPKDAGPPESSR